MNGRCMYLLGGDGGDGVGRPCIVDYRRNPTGDVDKALKPRGSLSDPKFA